MSEAAGGSSSAPAEAPGSSQAETPTTNHLIGEVIPGVMRDADFDPDQPQGSDRPTSKAEMRAEFEKREQEQDEDPSPKGKRDEKGRFVGKEGTEGNPALVGADPAAPASNPDAKTEPPLVAPTPTPAPFKVGELSFKDEQTALQAIRSFRGQAQSGAKRVAELEAENQRLRATPPSSIPTPAPNQTASQPREPGSSEGAGAEKGFLDSLTEADQQTYAEIMQDPEGGQAAANLFMMELHSQYVRKQFDDFRAPAKAAEENRAHVAEVTGLWQQAADYADADGTPFFPELGEPEAVDRILTIYKEATAGDKARALDPQIIYLSICRYRDEVAQRARRVAKAAPTAPVENIIPDQPEPERRPSMMPNSPVPTGAQRGGAPASPDSGDAVRRAIRQAGNFDSGLPGVAQ